MDDKELSLALETIAASLRDARAAALANSYVLAEIVRDLADSARNRHDYLADMFARISARAERSPIEGPPNGLRALFREELSIFFARVARGSISSDDSPGS
jgi:hypothetical protein